MAGVLERNISADFAMYPFSIPTEPVRSAMAEMGLPDPRQRFVDGLHAGLTTWLIGAAAQSEA
jgi:hypothetical protein